MLARYLREMSKPVRYASPYHDPASLQALMNFLAINTRSLGLPQQHREALAHQERTQSQGFPQLYEQNPAMPHMLQSLFSSHHPGDLAAYLDMAEEAGVPHLQHEADPYHVQFIQSLRHLHHMMLQGRGEQGVDPNIVRQYGEGSMVRRRVAGPVQRALQTPSGSMTPIGRLHNLAAALAGRALPRHAQQHEDVNYHIDNLFATGHPMSLVHLHDLADNVLHDDALPASAGNWGGGVRADMGSMLHRVVVPTLRGL